MTRYRWLAIPLLLAACSAPDDSSAPFSPVADVQQLMASVLEPAADTYWDAVGWILDENGTTEIRPSTPEEWEVVRNAAFVIAESGNLLMMTGRAIEEPAWTPMARALIDVGRRALEAADARDEAAVFDVGAEVYYVCSNCHVQFALETLPPSERPGDSPRP